MKNLYWLDKIRLQDRAQVGDKAFYLSKIVQLNYPVVPGFVISADVWRKFLATLNSSDSLLADLPDSSLHLDVSNWQQLQQVARRLREEVTGANIPENWVNEIYEATQNWGNKCLILRPTVNISSHTQVMGNISGLLDSVFCVCQPDAIAQGLKYTWSQLFRARSLLYWQNLGINLQKINLGVLVQPIENAIASGVFTANTYGAEIQATYGLGIAISKGEVLPDVYYVEENTGVVKEQQLGNKLITYSLPEDPFLSMGNNNNDFCVVSILDEEQQRSYSLSADNLQQIIILGQQLMNEMGMNVTFKWTVTPSQINITQINIPLSSSSNSQFMKGIAAAKGRVTASAYVVEQYQPKPEKIPRGVILIAPTVTTDWLPLLNEVVGIVTERGGLTSHGAILSRELGIPAVVSAKNITNLIQTGDKLLIDGDKGEIYHQPDNSLNFVNPEIGTINQEEKPFSGTDNTSQNQLYPAADFSMITTQLLVNLSQPSIIEKVKNLPVDGIGLLRSELMILNILNGENPYSWIKSGQKTKLLELLINQLEEFARGFSPRPIFYRSLDWRSEDVPTLSDSRESSQNSILGEHGTLSYLRNSALFELELKALMVLYKKGYTHINLILPFVRTVEEFIFCRHKIEEAGLINNPNFQLWIMAEVPSVLFLLPEYIKVGVDGISIGTNDLTQLILGIDREYGELTSIFNQPHPAVMSAIAQLIKMAKEGGIDCSICGQAPVLYPEIIDKLVEWGITSISVEPEAVDKTYRAIARAEKRLILDAARKQLGN